MSTPFVAVLVGSDSDLPVLKAHLAGLPQAGPGQKMLMILPRYEC